MPQRGVVQADLSPGQHLMSFNDSCFLWEDGKMSRRYVKAGHACRQGMAIIRPYQLWLDRSDAQWDIAMAKTMDSVNIMTMNKSNLCVKFGLKKFVQKCFFSNWALYNTALAKCASKSVLGAGKGIHPALCPTCMYCPPVPSSAVPVPRQLAGVLWLWCDSGSGGAGTR